MLQTHTPLYKDHFKQGQGHLRSRSLNELLNLFKPLTPGKFTPVNRSTYIKKRSYSDLSNNSNDGDDHDEANDNRATKRSRTAPPIQISHLNLLLFFEKNSSSSNTSSSVRSKSLSPQKTKFSYNDGLPPLPYLLDNTRDTGSGKATVTEPKVDLLASVETLETSPSSASISLPENLAHQSKQPSLSSAAPIKEFPRAQLQLKLSGVTLPSIADALKSLEKLSACVAPTVSLDYFDTYKPNDENWRYELLDSINKSSKNFNLDRYNYLNRNSSQNPDRNRVGKPQFNSKISPKILSNGKMQSQPHRQFNHHNSFKKINFPFESNYTYLNKTYLTDVEKYPEYLELAHSLIKLLRSRPAGDSVVHHLPSYTTKSDHESVSPPSTHTKISTVTSPYGNLNGYVRSPEAEINHQGHQHNPRLNIMPSPPLMGLAGLFIANSPPSSANNDAFGVIRSPISSALPQAPRIHTFSHDSTPNSAVAAAAANSAFNPFAGMVVQMPATPQRESRAPLTPPSSKSKTKTETKSPSKAPQLSTRVCISCGSDQSPCWRPSWSIKEGQLCNSCGLRYKKTSARCLNMECKKIPAKGEWSLMQSKGKLVFEDGSEAYNCLDCGHKVEVNK